MCVGEVVYTHVCKNKCTSAHAYHVLNKGGDSKHLSACDLRSSSDMASTVCRWEPLRPSESVPTRRRAVLGLFFGLFLGLLSPDLSSPVHPLQMRSSLPCAGWYRLCREHALHTTMPQKRQWCLRFLTVNAFSLQHMHRPPASLFFTHPFMSRTKSDACAA